MTDTTGKLIHVGLLRKDKKVGYLFLRQLSPSTYTWFQETPSGETQTEVSASSIAEAIRLARQQWKTASFRTLNCGFRYTLPERDEHGENALFYQMDQSYRSMNGVYFDEDYGHNCIVYNASQEAFKLWQRLFSLPSSVK